MDQIRLGRWISNLKLVLRMTGPDGTLVAAGCGGAKMVLIAVSVARMLWRSSHRSIYAGFAPICWSNVSVSQLSHPAMILLSVSW